MRFKSFPSPAIKKVSTCTASAYFAGKVIVVHQQLYEKKS